jgi:predicted transcriptional regulator
VLPGHGSVFSGCKGRTNELRYHHKGRLGEVLSLLEKRGISAYETASRMSWDIAAEYGSWDRFPPLQKSFATGEAIAHLKYLEEKKIIRRKTTKGKVIFLENADCQFRSLL